MFKRDHEERATGVVRAAKDTWQSPRTSGKQRVFLWEVSKSYACVRALACANQKFKGCSEIFILRGFFSLENLFSCYNYIFL